MSSAPRSTWLLAPLLCACAARPPGSDGDETGDGPRECVEIEEDPEPVEFVEDCWMDPGPRPDCLIRSHAIIECLQTSWTELGIRVAIEDDRAALLAGNGESTWLFHAGAEDFEVERLPSEFNGSLFLLSQDAEGRLGFALSEGEHQGLGSRIRFSTRSAGGWSHEQVAEGMVRLRDFELDGVGDPTIWYRDQQTDRMRRLTREAGSWTDEEVDADDYLRRDNLDAQDRPWRYDYASSDDGWQLIAEHGDQQAKLGAPAPSQLHYLALAPARPAAAEPGPHAMVVTLRSDGLHLLGSDDYDLTIPGSAPYDENDCPDPVDDCSTACQQIGSGLQPLQYAAARAEDGSVWVGWVTTQRDRWFEWYRDCDGPGTRDCVCVRAGIRDDQTTYTLHLARAFDDEVEERVTLDVRQLEPDYVANNMVRRSVDLRAYGERLAVGLMYESQPAKLALLEIDIGAK